MPKVPRRRMLMSRSQRRKRKENGNGQEVTEDNLSNEAESMDEKEEEYDSDDKLREFVNWSKDVGIILHDKVVCTSDGVSANYGMIATADIKKGENVFIIPRPAALTPENSAISDFISNNSERLASSSGWLPLILALMYEQLNPGSKWRTYLDTFPNFTNMELPMFWPLSELDGELKCTGMVNSVATDIQNMRKEYENILLPLILEHPEIFKDPKYKDFSFAKQICAFIMAYSFTDDITKQSADGDDSGDEDDEAPSSATIMVPMADLLNHVPDHNAELNLGESTFRMIAVKDIKKGDEVYNTYGKVSNYTLLLMYGFAVPPEDNPCNTVELKLTTIQKASDETSYPDKDVRFKYLIKKLTGEDESVDKVLDSHSICLHSEGLSDTSDILKVLRMDKEEVKAKLTTLDINGADESEDEDWMSDDEEDDEISSESVRKCDEYTKAMLLRVADLMLAEFPMSQPSEGKAGSGMDTSLNKKQLFATHVRDSQISLLRKLKQWVTWYD